MPDSATHRLAQRQAKARRNEARRKRRANPVVLSWGPRPAHRCTMCGRWIGLGAEAGYGYGLTWCADCHLAVELKRASVRARLLPMPMNAVAVTGAA